MIRKIVSIGLGGLIALAAVAPALAQPNPQDEIWRRQPPPCLDAWDAPSVIGSRGYRNAKVIDRIDTERVQVVADSGANRYLLVFNLCRQEIEDREAL
jgi:hypothetical protein